MLTFTSKIPNHEENYKFNSTLYGHFQLCTGKMDDD